VIGIEVLIPRYIVSLKDLTGRHLSLLDQFPDRALVHLDVITLEIANRITGNNEQFALQINYDLPFTLVVGVQAVGESAVMGPIRSCRYLMYAIFVAPPKQGNVVVIKIF